MGDVYLAFDEELNRKVAIKTFRSPAPEARERLRREALAQAQLSHANIVTVHRFIEGDVDEPCLVMEYVDGPTLEQVLAAADDSRLEWRRAAELCRQILAALQYVHGHGTVHRDVKPSNVMLAGDTVKLTDFGIALVDGVPRMTATSRVIGTWLYAAPEQFDPSGKLDHQCDVYSTGLVLYRMLGGYPAYPQKDQFGAMQARLYPPPDLRTAVPDLPPPLCEVVSIALRREPRNRFRSALEFSEALADAVSGLVPVMPQHDVATVPQPQPPAPAAAEVLTVPSAPPRPHKQLAFVSFLFIGVALLLSFGLWRALERQPSPPVVVHEPTPIMKKTQEEPVKTETEKPPVVVEKPSVDPPVNPPALPPEKRPVDLSPFRREIAEGLDRIQSLIAMKDFDAAQEALTRATELAQQHPAELSAEQDSIRAARAELMHAMVSEQTAADRKALEDAVWERRLREVESYLEARKLAEAKNSAEMLLTEANVPAAIALRARDLLERAREGIREGFEGTQLGQTKNRVVRKPSTPPRK